MIGSEALPFSKTGGLADVLGALPSALAHLGWDVTLVVPRYRGVSAGEYRETIGLRVGGVPIDVGIFETPLSDGGRVLLVEAPTLFDRETLYGVGQLRMVDFQLFELDDLARLGACRSGRTLVHG